MNELNEAAQQYLYSKLIDLKRISHMEFEQQVSIVWVLPEILELFKCIQKVPEHAIVHGEDIFNLLYRVKDFI